MNKLSRTIACLIGVFALTIFANAEERSVFSFKANNGVETIRGAMVLNRDAVRTTTATGFRFETPVDFLHYTISDSTGVVGSFTLTVDNPNVLTITKGTDGSTEFFLLVEPVPTDPPLPGTTVALTMTFKFAGAAPWGDWVPDRTIEGATDVSVSASDLYDQSVSISEVMVNELARQLAAANAELRRIRKELAKGK